MSFKILGSLVLMGVVTLVSASQVNPNTVVAMVGDKKITISDLEKAKAKAGGRVAEAPLSSIFKNVRDQVVVEATINDAKEKANLANDPEVIKMKQEAAKAIEMQVFLKRQLEKRITDDKLKPLYDQLGKKFKSQKETELAVIIVGNQNDANVVLGELNSGKDFYEMAAKYSIEPSTKKQGGRVGYLLDAAISQVFGPELSKSLSILKENVHSKKAIKSKDGRYIIFRKGATRAAAPPSFDDVKDQLKSVYAQKALMEYILELTKGGRVKVFTIEGKPDVLSLSAPKDSVGA